MVIAHASGIPLCMCVSYTVKVNGTPEYYGELPYLAVNVGKIHWYFPLYYAINLHCMHFHAWSPSLMVISVACLLSNTWH